jgi:hypothetical protein
MYKPATEKDPTCTAKLCVSIVGVSVFWMYWVDPEGSVELESTVIKSSLPVKTLKTVLVCSATDHPEMKMRRKNAKSLFTNTHILFDCPIQKRMPEIHWDTKWWLCYHLNSSTDVYAR